MDAKTKANFINSVAAGEIIPCTNCGKENPTDAKFCVVCGSTLQKPEQSAPAFAPVEDTANAPAALYKEPVSAFAEGLPDWDIVPPQVVVRRR